MTDRDAAAQLTDAFSTLSDIQKARVLVLASHWETIRARDQFHSFNASSAVMLSCTERIHRLSGCAQDALNGVEHANWNEHVVAMLVSGGWYEPSRVHEWIEQARAHA